MVFTVYDGVGYQTNRATSSDLLRWSQPEIIFSPRKTGVVGDFDYGGAAFVGPLLVDYNITSPRELRKVDGYFWSTYFGQPLRNSCEPPPGATGDSFFRYAVKLQR